jgi:hypothetical protein
VRTRVKHLLLRLERKEPKEAIELEWNGNKVRYESEAALLKDILADMGTPGRFKSARMGKDASYMNKGVTPVKSPYQAVGEEEITAFFESMENDPSCLKHVDPKAYEKAKREAMELLKEETSNQE